MIKLVNTEFISLVVLFSGRAYCTEGLWTVSPRRWRRKAWLVCIKVSEPPTSASDLIPSFLYFSGMSCALCTIATVSISLFPATAKHQQTKMFPWFADQRSSRALRNTIGLCYIVNIVTLNGDIRYNVQQSANLFYKMFLLKHCLIKHSCGSLPIEQCFPNLSWRTPALHILYVSLIRHTQFSSCSLY